MSGSRLMPEDIRKNLCTHLIYAFADIDPSTLQIIPIGQDDAHSSGLRTLYFVELNMYEQLLAIKISLNVKLLISLRIPQLNFMPFGASRFLILARNALDFMLRHNFDGIDIFGSTDGLEVVIKLAKVRLCGQ
ncbi:probable chitinase 10 [Octopus sinensis]|uniref:Probable chitinase 10 n=1 Tax=Octopus sinensis TaxID=2607531 RepID=A0A6P7TUF1_9MOLL|nr:probable chitinase 10 [Octopus sinensis]